MYDQAKVLKTQISALEDQTKVVVVKVDESKQKKALIEGQIEDLRNKLKQIEKNLKLAKAKSRQKQSMEDIKKEDGSIDYSSLIERVREQLEQDINDLTDRVESLEDDNGSTKSKTAKHQDLISDLTSKL